MGTAARNGQVIQPRSRAHQLVAYAIRDIEVNDSARILHGQHVCDVVVRLCGCSSRLLCAQRFLGVHRSRGLGDASCCLGRT